MYQQILIPTDGSAGATKAIHEGVRLADLTGATVHGLYVVDTRDYNTLPESKWLTLADELEAAGETALEAIQTEAEAVGVPSETASRKGIPHEEILRYVADHDIDLIVMGTHGRTGFNRFLIGSVTEKIIRQTPIPVHIVRINEDD